MIQQLKPGHHGKTSLRRIERILRIEAGLRPVDVVEAFNTRMSNHASKTKVPFILRLHPTKGYRLESMSRA